MKIANEFTKRTIELEESRNPGTMSDDDLYWSFETKIIFYGNESSAPLLTIEEASFFQFLCEFKEILDSISTGRIGEYTIDDQEGSFSLTIASDRLYVTILKDNPFQSFNVSLKMFFDAAYQWMEEAVENVEHLFPALKDNEEYRNLKIQFQGRES